MNPVEAGEAAYCLVRELFPICRSITGDGVRRTLGIIGERIPLRLKEVPTGTQVFDWTVPREWNIRDAYVEDPSGRRIIEFSRSNLHLLSYSVPVQAAVSLQELKAHLYSLPEHPGWVPYRTSYYREDWGFCLSHRQLQALEQGRYRVLVDSTLQPGHLSFGECLLPGESAEEVLVSTHVCHPSMANDNLSGIAVAAGLAAYLQDRRHKYSYRFLFIPGTIGAITWLSLNRAELGRIRHGLVLTGLGDRGRLTYQKSRGGLAAIDRAACYVLRRRDPDSGIRQFSPYGYDERQYCSPGFNLPVGRLSRTPFGEYPEYHSSADDLQFVSSGQLGDSLEAVAEIFEVLEGDLSYRNLYPFGEPQLGRRGLYDHAGPEQLAMLWVLNLSDGAHSLLDIAERSATDFRTLRAAADRLLEHGLLAPHTS